MLEWHTRDPLRLMRVTTVLQSAALLAQAVTAGLLLASVSAGLTAHGVLAGTVVLVVLLNLLGAVLAGSPELPGRHIAAAGAYGRPHPDLRTRRTPHQRQEDGSPSDRRARRQGHHRDLGGA
ncbi:hypothetical protein [Planomonospora sp. ID82291]|uniref:hypothetical protein n=1 Tax=Planomonospora sp. ID82291 TaxID=2738136 RepID=UPI001E53E6A9|nr:hypothetical protein [Planomonospora sp. ID82291]